MRILANSSSLIRGGKLNFQAVEGVEPYIFSIASGSGTIDSATGAFNAANKIETVIIKVEDANNELLLFELSILSHLELFSLIIREELDLEDDQVYIFNQKYFIPKDYRLYIAVSVGSVTPFGVFNKDGMQHANFKSSLEVNLLSKGPDALERKEEIIMALNSDRSKRIQQQNGFYIAPLSSQFNNLSELESVSELFRFTLSINVQYTISKILNDYKYYDTFRKVNVKINK